MAQKMKNRGLSALIIYMILTATIAFSQESQEIELPVRLVMPFETNEMFPPITIEKVSWNILGNYGFDNSTIQISNSFNINTTTTRGVQFARFQILVVMLRIPSKWQVLAILPKRELSLLKLGGS